MSTGLRYTLDIAHIIDGRVIRRHLANLHPSQAIDLEAAERIMPGRVYVERSRWKPGDHSWTTEWQAA